MATKKSKIRTRRVQIEKNLDRAFALRRALSKSPGDFRGFKYEPKTGRASLT